MAETPATSGGGGPGENARPARWLPVGVLIALALAGGAVLAWHQLKTNKELQLLAYRTSLIVLEPLADVDPGWEVLLSLAHEWIGDVLSKQGKHDEALLSYLASLAIREQLAADHPNNARFQRDLSVSQVRMGDALGLQGEFNEALASYRDALVIREWLAKTDPSDAETQHDLSVVYGRVGDTLAAQGELDEALTSFRDALASAERAAKVVSSNADWRWDVVHWHLELAQRGDDPERRWAFIVAEIRRLKDENRLRPDWARFLPIAEEQLTKVREVQAAPQRPLTPP